MHFFRFAVWEIVLTVACFRCEASAVYGSYNGSNFSNVFDRRPKTIDQFLGHNLISSHMIQRYYHI